MIQVKVILTLKVLQRDFIIKNKILIFVPEAAESGK